MTPLQFKKIQSSLGLRAGDMAELLGKSRQAVYHYRTGQLAVPRTVVMMLKIIKEIGVDIAKEITDT